MPPTPSRVAAKDTKPGLDEEEAAPAKSPEPSAGGLKPWLPLLANLILMPALAYVTVTFLLAHQLQSPAVTGATSASAAPKSAPATVKATIAAKGGAEKKDGAKAKINQPLKGKVLVNLAGSQGTRYLLANITLVGTADDFKTKVVDENDALVDAAMNALRTKTISDLEKPAAMNLIRAELISVFNNILGNGFVESILLTEFAIQ